MTEPKPVQRVWQILKTTYPFVTPWFRVRQDYVITHLGNEITYAYYEHPGCVLIVALTVNRQIVLLEHYRHPIYRWCIEIPAGRLCKQSTKLEVAQKELLEEAGGTAKGWKHIGEFYTSTGSSNERAEIYFASEVTIQGNQPELTELLEVKLIPWREAVQMAQSGGIADGPSALALLMSSPHIERYCRNFSEK